MAQVSAGARRRGPPHADVPVRRSPAAFPLAHPRCPGRRHGARRAPAHRHHAHDQTPTVPPHWTGLQDGNGPLPPPHFAAREHAPLLSRGSFVLYERILVLFIDALKLVSHDRAHTAPIVIIVIFLLVFVLLQHVLKADRYSLVHATLKQRKLSVFKPAISPIFFHMASVGFALSAPLNKAAEHADLMSDCLLLF